MPLQRNVGDSLTIMSVTWDCCAFARTGIALRKAEKVSVIRLRCTCMFSLEPGCCEQGSFFFFLWVLFGRIASKGAVAPDQALSG